jgi:hypothetical protein
MTAKPKRQLQKLNTTNNLSSLSAVVMALNGNNSLIQDSEDRAALVRYVEYWKNNEAWKNKAKRLTVEDAERFSLSNLERVWKWRLAPISGTWSRALPGRCWPEPRTGAYWHPSPTGENCRDIAAMFAGMLLTNPLRAKLSDGPCQRDRCNKWFIKRKRGQKCCSRRCGAIVRTAERVSDKREDEKKEKLKMVHDAHREWRKSMTRIDWKAYVAKKTGFSKKFLTRNFTKEGRVKNSRLKRI